MVTACPVPPYRFEEKKPLVKEQWRQARGRKKSICAGGEGSLARGWRSWTAFAHTKARSNVKRLRNRNLAASAETGWAGTSGLAPLGRPYRKGGAGGGASAAPAGRPAARLSLVSHGTPKAQSIAARSGPKAGIRAQRCQESPRRGRPRRRARDAQRPVCT